MGLPTDNIHVEPGTVDWLYGENMPEPNTEGDDEDNECSPDVDNMPMIKARDEETEEGIFSSGHGAKQNQTADIFTLEGRRLNSMSVVSTCLIYSHCKAGSVIIHSSLYLLA